MRTSGLSSLYWILQSRLVLRCRGPSSILTDTGLPKVRAATVGRQKRARGRGQAAARDGQGRRRLEGYRRSDAAVVGRRERARGRGQVAARDGQGRCRLEGYR